VIPLTDRQTDITLHYKCVTTSRITGRNKPNEMKKALRETQTLRGNKFRPGADPLPWGAGPQKFNQLEIVSPPAPTDPVW